MKPTLYDYLPRADADAITKLAEGEGGAKQKLKSVLQMVGGMGVGTLSGAGLMHYANKAHQHFTGKPISPSALQAVVPILGAGLGLAYNLGHAHQQKEMNGAGNQSSHDNGGRIPEG